MAAVKTVSVVLASYNGIKFIGEQLDSIRAQTRLPDEVIISDDCSTDGTYEFCLDYISRHKLKGWHVFRNESNLGHRKNFRQALLKCTGDYVFTCDQDDIWLPEKIQIMTQVLDSHPEIKLLVSNFIIFLDGITIKGKTHHKYASGDDGSLRKLELSDLWLRNQRPGCVYCFRHELIDKFNVMDLENHFHDEMIFRYAIVSDSLWLLNRKLVRWRRHGGNATIVFKRKYPDVSQRIKSTAWEQDWYKKFLDASDKLNIPEKNQKLLAERIKFLERRKKVLEKRNVFLTSLFVLMNFKFYFSARNALSDIYAMIFLRT